MWERKILYYPTILVPARWQRMTILYWDKISSIVPEKWDDEVGLSPSFGNSQADKSYCDMKYLEAEGEYEPIRPENNYVPIEHEFKRKINSFGISDGNDMNRKNSYMLVHKDKIAHHLYDFLKEKNLVLDEKSNENWYYMEKETSLLYMALLAKYMAEHMAKYDKKYVVTGTDSEDYQTMTFNGNTEYKRFLSYDTLFRDILPVPSNDVSMEDILKFKHERENELLQFRVVIDETTEKISKAESQNEMNKILTQQEERLKVELSKLKRDLKSSGIKATLTSFKSLMNVKEPGFLATLGITANIPVLAGVGGIGIVGAWIDAANEQRAKALDSPYSYLYYADKADILDLSYLESRKRGNIIQRLFRR
jgi:hypothetical protein